MSVHSRIVINGHTIDLDSGPNEPVDLGEAEPGRYKLGARVFGFHTPPRAVTP